MPAIAVFGMLWLADSRVLSGRRRPDPAQAQIV